MRAWSIGSKGIKEHARLFDPTQLSGIIGIGTLWQIASIVVAQKHLHDISEKLQVISRRIEDIHAFQKDHRRSIILGCRKYFEQAYADIKFGRISSSLQSAIEAQCVELMKVEEHLRLDLRKNADAVKRSELGKKFNELLPNWIDDMRILFVCIETRLLGYQLMAIGSEDADAMDNRLDGIRHDIEGLQKSAILFSRHIDDVLSKEVSFWENISRVEESLDMLKELQPRKELGKSFEHADEEVGLAQNIIEQRKAPQEILLKVNGGKIEGFSVAEA